MRIGSLFSGAGGLDMAVEEVFGGRTVWHSEIDKAASKVLAYRWPDVPNLGSITEIDWATVEPVDVLCGGFPCQDVSAAGKRAGIKDGTRSGLWAIFAEAIDALRPQYVVIENVRGLLSATAHRDMESADPVMGDGSERPVLRAAGAVLGDLADLGYDAVWATVAAADVGAPHRRERVFILATDAQRFGLAGPEWAAIEGASSAVRGGSGCGTTTTHSGGAAIGESAGSASAEKTGQSSGDRPGDYGGERTPRNGRQACVCGCKRIDHDWFFNPGRFDDGGCRLCRCEGFWPAEPGVALLPTPAAGNFNDGEEAEQWLARQAAVKERLNNGNGMGMPLAIAVQLLPTPSTHDKTGARSPESIARMDKPFANLNDTVVNELGVERGPEPVDVGVGEDDSSVPVLPGDGGREDALVIALNGDGVAVDVGGAENSHSSYVPAELAGTKSNFGDLLPTPAAADGSRGQDYARAGREGSGGDDLVTALVKHALLPTPTAGDGMAGGSRTVPDGKGGRREIDWDDITRSTGDGGASRLRDTPGLIHGSQWGKYAPAIARWEQIVGPAPAPTEPNKNGNPRLSAAFSEWLMGWPSGWVTDPAIGISRNDQLRIVGNGVCTQQAIAALRYLLAVTA